MATPNIYSATALTGGSTGSLDSLNGSLLNDGDKCLTIILSTGERYWHYLDSDSGEAESSPSVISPDSNAGTKRWKISGIGQIDVHDHADADGGGQISYTNLTNKLVAAVASDVNTGTDSAKFITPDALAGSNLGKRGMLITVFPWNVSVIGGDNQLQIPIPNILVGMNLVAAHAQMNAYSTSGLPTIQIYSYNHAHDVLSTRITLDVGEYTSRNALTQPVIDTLYDNVTANDWYRVDVDNTGTGTIGLFLELEFQLP